MYSLLAHSLNGECATNLQEMLEVSICILVGFPIKRTSLNHRNYAGLSSKLASPLITFGPVATLAAEGIAHDRVR
jgi:hypothetical protein